jgi:transcriptional regulator with XRE-family HTH domain
LATKLKQVGKAKGFSHEELTLESGLSLSQIARIETTKINLTVNAMFQKARTLRVNVREIFDFKLK